MCKMKGYVRNNEEKNYILMLLFFYFLSTLPCACVLVHLYLKYLISYDYAYL